MKIVFGTFFLVGFCSFIIAKEISVENERENCQEKGDCFSYREDSGLDLQRSVIVEQEWLLTNASEKGGWGLSTVRIVTTLGLTKASHVFYDSFRGKLNLKEMELQISLALARNEKKHLSLFVNALLSVCQDPRNFYGFDLVSKLVEYAKEDQFDSDYENALIYLVMCNAGVAMNKTEHKRVIFQIHKYSKRETTLSDTLSVYILALICFSKQEGSNYERRVNKVVQVLKSKQSEEDGSFGNFYTSALVLQALNAAKTDENGWNSTLAKQFILSERRDDGSFEGYLATYFALPALDGKSLVHIGPCSDPKEDEEVVISHNETVEDTKIDPGIVVDKFVFVDIWKVVENETVAATEMVKQNYSLYDILRSSKSFDCVFKQTDFGPMLISVDDLEQNPRVRTYWAILRRKVNPAQTFRDEYLTSGAAGFNPKDGDIIVLKYDHYE